MDSMTIHLVCEVPIDDALAASCVLAGRFDWPLSDSDLHELKRLDLVDVARPFLTIEPHAHPVALTVGADRRGVDGRRTAESIDTRIIPALQALRAAKERALAEEQARAVALRAFLELRGAPHQVARFNAGVLAPEEIHSLLRDICFAESHVLSEAPKHMRLVPHDFAVRSIACGRMSLKDAARGAVTPPHDPVFETVLKVSLDPAEHEICEQIRRAADMVAASAPRTIGITDVKANVVRRTHVMRCKDCGATIRRKSAMVTFTWNGITVGRELSLEPRP